MNVSQRGNGDIRIWRDDESMMGKFESNIPLPLALSYSVAHLFCGRQKMQSDIIK